VRGVVDLLSPKVPDIQAKELSVLQAEFVPVNGDAPGGLAFLGQRMVRLIQTPQQAGLARTTFAQDEHFGFIQMVNLSPRQFTKVVDDGLFAPRHDLTR